MATNPDNGACADCSAHAYTIQSIADNKKLNEKLMEGQQHIRETNVEILASIKEQIRATAFQDKRIEKLENKVEQLQKRVWQYAGGVAVAALAIELFLKFKV